MLNRAKVVDEQFVLRLRQSKFPDAKTNMGLAQAGLEKDVAIDLFDSQIKSRLLDLKARELKEEGRAYYTIASSGHEGNAALAHVFRLTDMAFLHYRSGAFYIQRAKKIKGHDPVRDILLSLLAAADDPIAGGRHKVFGHLALTIPPQTSTIASHLPKALGAAFSIHRAKELNLVTPLLDDSVILCSFGDASLNHASAQTSLNAGSWIGSEHYPLPLVFICEDNGWGISVPTPSHWIEASIQYRPALHYLVCDGLNLADVYAKACEAEYLARVKKQFVFLHLRCVRLLGHAGSDIESQYRSQQDIERSEADDPLLHTASLLYREGWMSPQQCLDLYQTNRALIDARAREVINHPPLQSAASILCALIPVPQGQILSRPTESQRQQVFAAAYPQLSQPRNLCQLINFALTDLLLQHPNMVIFGEDVGRKGGVYRVTADLQARFGPRRVFDTLLDETTILGTAIGFAHNGFIPVPEIQFLAYLHNAEDQLRGEAATLSFFSNRQYQNPMLIRIAAFAYQKGFGGHFHNDNSIAVLRDLPGVVVVCPSNGQDAAKLLRTCMDMVAYEGRIVVFLEPIALYMTKDLHATGDNAWLFEYPPPKQKIAFAEVSVYGEGDIVIISYANGYYLSRQAEKILRENEGIAVKVVDLHWLSPLPIDAICAVVSKASHVLIVDEGRRSASLSEGLMSLLLERIEGLKLKRLTGEDCFIPIGLAWQYILPSREKIVATIKAWVNEQGGFGRG
jgi:2-oxoisovalerate dehydrogenase E1 component